MHQLEALIQKGFFVQESGAKVCVNFIDHKMGRGCLGTPGRFHRSALHVRVLPSYPIRNTGVMSQGKFRIFLSAVTSEFGKARDALAADLRSREALLRVQSDFRQEPGSDTTLKKLHDYIRDCSAVVCVMGRRSGALPAPAAAEFFADMLPKGMAKASYTQWEFFFARHYQRRLSIYIANEDYQPDTSEPTSEDDPELQQAFLAHVVEEQGLDRGYFSNEDQLGRAVLREDWPKKREHPIALPYLSLGGLFKGRSEFLQKLHKKLNRDDAAIVAAVLYGLGGIGKTRAAVEYAWAHHDQYTALLFVIAGTPEALPRNLAALAGPLVLNLPEKSAPEEEVRLKAVLDWLKENPGWFLILDNVDTPEALADAESLLSKLSGGQAVITTRLANFAGHFDALELDVLRRRFPAGAHRQTAAEDGGGCSSGAPARRRARAACARSRAG